MNHTSPLDEHKILGISSMIRDLRLLSRSPERMEEEILANSAPIKSSLFSDLRLISGPGIRPRVGDVVLFRLKKRGAYTDMETLWGGRVPLHVGGEYVGVLCERCSTKLITGTLEGVTNLLPALELQLIAQAGGIGLATGFSPDLRKTNQCGQAPDVEIVGALYSQQTSGVLNISDRISSNSTDLSTASVPPTVMVIGTATDVGKTSTVCALLREFSVDRACMAIKATGTGWYEDSLLHARSGAFPVLNFTFVGLPTTYRLDEKTFLRAMRQLFSYVAAPHNIPGAFIQPHRRASAIARPELLIVEHGGDFISAGIPHYLQDSALMSPVKVLIVCSESALGLRGAVEELRRMGIRNAANLKIFATVPLINPEAFYNRTMTLLQSGLIEGILDVNKPTLTEEKGRRCNYSAHYTDILSRVEFVKVIKKLLAP